MRASPFGLHAVIQFETSRPAARRRRFGLTSLTRPTTTYHRPLRDRRTTASVHALRCQTSRFRFPDLGRLAAHRARRSPLPLGLPRAHRT